MGQINWARRLASDTRATGVVRKADIALFVIAQPLHHSINLIAPNIPNSTLSQNRKFISTPSRIHTNLSFDIYTFTLSDAVLF